MPTSDFFNITPMMYVIAQLRPQSLLDVGCGFGKYGVLVREYLDVWHERYDCGSWKCRIVGVDGFAAYRNPIWDYVYQEVIVGDAQEVVPRLEGPFDVSLLADVIEHLEKEAACRLVAACLEKSAVCIVSTPKEFYPQHDVMHNEFERHRCLWAAGDFPPAAHVMTIPALTCNIFVASRKPLQERELSPATLPGLAYLRSRHRLRWLGPLGWPASAALRVACRLLT